MSTKKYALIIGNGRTGTNWVLDILDASPDTHCRNEPHRILDSPLHVLTKHWQVGTPSPIIVNQWDEYASWTKERMGERDHRITAPKHHVHPLAQKLGLAYFPARPKIRKVLSLFFPQFRRGEWKMPWWIGDQNKLREACAIFKIINTDVPTITWLLENRPQVPIIHVIRHPGGRLNSWLNRFMSQQEEADILRRNQQRLAEIKKSDTAWSENFGEIQALDLIESELLLWRFYNEKVYQAGKSKDNYLCIVYEKLAQDPLTYGEKIYEFLNLSWTETTKDLVYQGLGESVWGKISGNSQSVSEAWKKKLDSETIHKVNQVLETSFLKDWWS